MTARFLATHAVDAWAQAEMFAPKEGRPLATWSACQRYRYTLRRSWVEAPTTCVLWIMLNPSTADEVRNDPTISKCIRYSKRWGYDALIIVNAYAWRSTDPAGLWEPVCTEAGGPVGPENDAAIDAACLCATPGYAVWPSTSATYGSFAGSPPLIVCAWGNELRADRRTQLAELLRGRPLTGLHFNKDGSPSHPLYLKNSASPQPFLLA